MPPLPLNIFLCPHSSCRSFSSTMIDAIAHIRNTHPSYRRFETNFGVVGLEALIPHATLYPGRTQTAICVTCSKLLPTIEEAETHLLTTPAHAAAVAQLLLLRGRNALHRMLQTVHVVIDIADDAGGAPPQPSPVHVRRINNWIYGANPNLIIGSAAAPHRQAAIPGVPKGGNILLRILLGPQSGGTVEVGRGTAYSQLAGLLEEALPATVDWARVVAAGMRFTYASRKLDGGAGEIDVRGERSWRRLMGDVVRGGRADWEQGLAEV